MAHTHAIVTYWPTSRSDPAARRGVPEVAAARPGRPVLTSAMLLAGVASLSLTYRLDAFPIDRSARFESIARVELAQVAADPDTDTDEAPSAPAVELTNAETGTPVAKAKREIQAAEKPRSGTAQAPRRHSRSLEGFLKDEGYRFTPEEKRDQGGPAGTSPPEALPKVGIERLALGDTQIAPGSMSGDIAPDKVKVALDSDIFKPAALSDLVPGTPVANEMSAASQIDGRQPAIQSFPKVRIGATMLGAVTMRTGSSGQATIHIGGLLNLLQLKLPKAEFERFSGASAAHDFVSLDELRRSGIDARLSADSSELILG